MPSGSSGAGDLAMVKEIKVLRGIIGKRLRFVKKGKVEKLRELET